MNTAEQIILIILAATLALFLLLAIVLAAQLIRLVKILRGIAERAEEFVTSAESAADMIKNAVGRFTVLKFVSNMVDMVTKHKSNKRE